MAIVTRNNWRSFVPDLPKAPRNPWAGIDPHLIVRECDLLAYRNAAECDDTLDFQGAVEELVRRENARREADAEARLQKLATARMELRCDPSILTQLAERSAIDRAAAREFCRYTETFGDEASYLLEFFARHLEGGSPRSSIYAPAYRQFGEMAMAFAAERQGGC